MATKCEESGSYKREGTHEDKDTGPGNASNRNGVSAHAGDSATDGVGGLNLDQHRGRSIKLHDLPPRLRLGPQPALRELF